MRSSTSNAKKYMIESLVDIEHKELFRLYKDTKDIEIRNELINRYLYIAEILSKKYINKGIDYDDIYQVASLGLIYAIERFDVENKPGVSNLMVIYNTLSGMSLDDIESKYKGLGYGAFKKDLVEVVVSALEPIQSKYEEILKSGEVEKVLKEGAEKAKEVSNGILNKVKKKIGFVMF